GALLSWLRGEEPAVGAAGQAARLLPAGAGAAAMAELSGNCQAGVVARGAGPGGEQDRDLADVVRQPAARRAAEICAPGRPHPPLLGPPGVGKTMLAERLPTILPRLELTEALEVSTIHSVAGALPAGRPLISEPPFCAPHHTATKAA